MGFVPILIKKRVGRKGLLSGWDSGKISYRNWKSSLESEVGMRKTVTLKTLANELGISAMAVSKALRDDSSISEETRKKVKELAKELNYYPNNIAKSLKSNRTYTLGLVISDSSMSLFASMIEEIERTAQEHGFNIILTNTFSDKEREMNAIRTLLSKGVDGIIIAATMLAEKSYKEFFDQLGVPYMFVVRQPDFPAGYVINDNCHGSKEMVNYLLDTGSTKIHFLNLPDRINSSYYRLKGYKEALEERGMEFDKKLVHNVAPSVKAGYEMMKSLLEHEKVETIFCGCDLIAVGAMEYALEKGYRIPEDIRVASYDDIEFAPYFKVPLTTVRQPTNTIGKLAAMQLIESITEEKANTTNIVIRPEIVVRKST